MTRRLIWVVGAHPDLMSCVYCMAKATYISSVVYLPFCGTEHHDKYLEGHLCQWLEEYEKTVRHYRGALAREELQRLAEKLEEASTGTALRIGGYSAYMRETESQREKEPDLVHFVERTVARILRSLNYYLEEITAIQEDVRMALSIND